MFSLIIRFYHILYFFMIISEFFFFKSANVIANVLSKFQIFSIFNSYKKIDHFIVKNNKMSCTITYKLLCIKHI